MNEKKEEKIIRKLYGEKMWHYCRESFPSILDTPGKLSEILQNLFAPSHNIYNALYESNNINNFKNIIYKEFLGEEEYDNSTKHEIPSPKELLDEAGYILFECKTEEDIQSFKKYYAKDEELCTFNGGRLNRYHVFFAVKKNVNEIKRENFINPERQDEYGTSVISIQFSRDETNHLSIKNRYNHSVSNPDATFSNDLEKIIPGLTESFEQYYGLIQKVKQEEDLEGFVKASDGKYYKYNYEIDNVYYCENNIIIDDFMVIDKYNDISRYLLIDQFVLDLKEKKCFAYDNSSKDSLPNTLKNIDKINIEKTDLGKKIIINQEGNEVIIDIDKYNRITSYSNPNIKRIERSFLFYNKVLNSINLPNVEIIEDDFLNCNNALSSINVPNVVKIGTSFLYNNNTLTSIDVPNAEIIEVGFLYKNSTLRTLNAPKLKIIKEKFLYNNKDLTSINVPSLEIIEDYFLDKNNTLTSISLPNVKHIKNSFMQNNNTLTSIYVPNVEIIESFFLYHNNTLTSIDIPKVIKILRDFLSKNKVLESINAPNVKIIGLDFLYENKGLKSIDVPNLETAGDGFLENNENILKNSYYRR